MEISDHTSKVKDSEAKRAREQLLADADFKAVATTPEGRRVIRRLLTECGVYQMSYSQGDLSLTAYREGRRSIGLWLLSLFADLPETYITLLTEKHHD